MSEISQLLDQLFRTGEMAGSASNGDERRNHVAKSESIREQILRALSAEQPAKERRHEVVARLDRLNNGRLAFPSHGERFEEGYRQALVDVLTFDLPSADPRQSERRVTQLDYWSLNIASGTHVSCWDRRKPTERPWKVEDCQHGGDLCLAGQRGGVRCPEDSCDIDDGLRKPTERVNWASQEGCPTERAETYMVGEQASNELRLPVGTLVQVATERAAQQEPVPARIRTDAEVDNGNRPERSKALSATSDGYATPAVAARPQDETCMGEAGGSCDDPDECMGHLQCAKDELVKRRAEIAAAPQEAAPKDVGRPVIPHRSGGGDRPGQEWYRSKIELAGDADFSAGPAAPREPQEPVAWRVRRGKGSDGYCDTRGDVDFWLKHDATTPTEVTPLYARPAPEGWVSVSERLPELSTYRVPKYVLACDALGRMSIAYAIPNSTVPAVWIMAKQIGPVTHWMPLPATPEPK